MWLTNDLLISLAFVVFLANVSSIKHPKTIEREKELEELLNWSVDPCDDFYGFACGNYEARYPIPSYRQKYDVLDRITEDNYEVLDKLLRDNIDEVLVKEIVSAQDKAKAFYSLCNNITALNDEGINPLWDFLHTVLGGFPPLDQYWNNPNFNWISMIIEVHRVLYTNPLFKESMQLKDNQNVTTQTIPQFGPPISALDNTDASKNKLRAILKEFGLNQVAVDSIFDEFYIFYDDLKAIQNFTNKTPKTANISTFGKLVPEFDWRSFVEGVYDLKASDGDYIAVTDVGYFQLLTCLLKRKSPSVIANFIILNFINDLLPVLDTNFMKAQHKYDEESIGLKSPKDRWRHCIDVTVDVMNYPTAALFINKTNLHYSRTSIQSIENTLKNEFKDFLKNSIWPEKDSKNKTFEKISSFQTDLSWEDFLYDSAKMDEQYKELVIHKNNFFQTFINASRIKIQQIGKMYRSKSKEFWSYPLVSAKRFRAPAFNKFLIHPGLLESPFYHESFTKFLEYGGLGVLLAHEIFHSFDIIGSLYHEDGTEQYWWSVNNTNLYYNKSQCFKDQYDNYTINGLSLKDRPVDYEIIADNSAVNFAYMAYNKFLNTTHTLDETIAGLNLTSRQLLFVSMAQGLCTTVRPNALKYFIKNHNYVTGPWRVNGIVQNSHDFSKQFNCPPGSRMNPTNKCNSYS